MRWDPVQAFPEGNLRPRPGMWRPGVVEPPRPPDRSLTPRESGVAALVLEDRTAAEIAAAVGLAGAGEVAPVLDSIARKVGARTRWGLALRLGGLLGRDAVEAA
jgi:hypothetical protein